MDLTREQLARVWLQCAPMGAWNRLRQLTEKEGGAEALWASFSPALYDLLGKENFPILNDLRQTQCARILRVMDEARVTPVFLGAANYPERLASIQDAPDVLFVRGALPLDLPAVAIVGSRRSTRYGSTQARKIAREVSMAGISVVSGMARGIDTAAHLGALDGGAPTVAVLGCGVTQAYPPENRELAQTIIDSGGAVISELSPDAPPLPYHFPVRNRIISGLSQGVLLVEATEKSGTQSTGEPALAQGREVFALPGNVDSPGSELPLRFLREGASMCTCGEDIIQVLAPRREKLVQSSFLPEDSPEDAGDPVLNALAMEEKTLEELIDETGLSAGELGTRLTLLELEGRVERRAGRAYARIKQ